MKESYEALELEHIKREISRYCAFSLGVHEIMNAKPYFDSLHVKRELRRSPGSDSLYDSIRYDAIGRCP